MQVSVRARTATKKTIAPVRDWALALSFTTLTFLSLLAVGLYEYTRTDLAIEVAGVVATRSYDVPDIDVLQAMVAQCDERSVTFNALLAEYKAATPAYLEQTEEVDEGVSLEDGGVDTDALEVDETEGESPELVP